MSNLLIITNNNDLNKIFENAHDKLVILMFYIKNNPDCRKAKPIFETLSCSHNITIFCLVDMDKFDGTSRYTRDINNMPRFDFYYAGNLIGNIATCNERELDECIKSGERNVMTQNNKKNSNINNNQNQFGMFNQTGQQQQINPIQIQQQILNNAMAQNPQYANQLMQNPTALQQLVQQQILVLQQQQQQQMMNSQMNMMNTTAVQQVTPVQQVSPIYQQNNGKNDLTSMFQQMSLDNSQINAKIMEVVPTFQQLHQMLQIFQMLQQMGALNIPASLNEQKIESKTESKDNTVIELPNGDKLIPLPGGKYGLIKKS
jgi:thiol-disulfide isomerase/thioredoxin